MNIIIEGEQGCGKTFAAWNIIKGITKNQHEIVDMVHVMAPYTKSVYRTLLNACNDKKSKPLVILYDEAGVTSDFQAGLCIKAVNRYRIKSGNKNVVAIIVKQL